MSNVRLIPQIYFPGNNTTFGIQQVLNKLRQSANEVLSYIQTSSSGGGICIPNNTWANEVDAIVLGIPSLVPTSILVGTNPTDLQTAINNLISGGVLQVNTNAVYSPIQIPANKPMTIKAGDGFNPVITGTNGIRLLDQAHDVTISGITLDQCSTGDSNALGSAICLDHLAVVNRIIFYNVSITNVINGSGVMLSYHQSISGDDYAKPNVFPTEFSNRLAFVNCAFFHGGVEGTEGANLSMRGIYLAYVNKCVVDGDNADSRGIQFQNCINYLCQDCVSHGFNGPSQNNDAYKSDEMDGSGTYPVPPYKTSGTHRRCVAYDCVTGFNIEDWCSGYLTQCEAYNCSFEAFHLGYCSYPGSPTLYTIGTMECCKGYNSATGTFVQIGVSDFLRWNNMYNNTSIPIWTQDYNMANSAPLDSSNVNIP